MRRNEIRELAVKLLDDGLERTLHELVVTCNHLIRPEQASRAYIHDTGCKKSQSVRRAKPTEYRVTVGRYMVVKNSLRVLVDKKELLKSGAGMDSIYRKVKSVK